MDNPVATLATINIRPFVGLKDSEDAYTDPDPIPVFEKIEQICGDHLENIDSHLVKTLRMATTPLA
jgi:hypothetical protein